MTQLEQQTLLHEIDCMIRWKFKNKIKQLEENPKEFHIEDKTQIPSITSLLSKLENEVCSKIRYLIIPEYDRLMEEFRKQQELKYK